MVCVTAPIVMHLFMLCTIFDRKTACNLFQILFAPLPPPPKKPTQIEIFKNPDLDLIRRIRQESGFYGFMIGFWICPKRRKIQFWIRKSWFWFSPQKVHTKYRRFREGSFAAHSQFYVWFPRLFDCNITVGAATPLTSKNSLVTKNVNSLFWCSPSAILVNRI